MRIPTLTLLLATILSPAWAQFVETSSYENTWARNSNYDYRFEIYEKERAATDAAGNTVIGDFEKYTYSKTLQYERSTDNWRTSSFNSDNIYTSYNQTDGWSALGSVDFATHWKSQNRQSRYLRGEGTSISNLESAIGFEDDFLADAKRGSAIFQEFTFDSSGSVLYDFGMWNDMANDDFAFYSISKLDQPGGNIISTQSAVIMSGDIFNGLSSSAKINRSRAGELFDQTINIAAAGTYQIAFGVVEQGSETVRVDDGYWSDWKWNPSGGYVWHNNCWTWSDYGGYTQEWIDESYTYQDYGYDPHFKIDNIRFSSAQEAIPEPSTYGIIGASFLGLLIISRKYSKAKKKKAQAAA